MTFGWSLFGAVCGSQRGSIFMLPNLLGTVINFRGLVRDLIGFSRLCVGSSLCVNLQSQSREKFRYRQPLEILNWLNVYGCFVMFIAVEDMTKGVFTLTSLLFLRVPIFQTRRLCSEVSWNPLWSLQRIGGQPNYTAFI